MQHNVELAKKRLFGNGGLGVRDIKIFHGTDRDATPEQMASQVNKVLSQLDAGDFEIIE